MLENAHLLAKIGVDTAENEPAKNLQNGYKQLQNLPFRSTPSTPAADATSVTDNALEAALEDDKREAPPSASPAALSLFRLIGAAIVEGTTECWQSRVVKCY